jgi:hypothetical protein
MKNHIWSLPIALLLVLANPSVGVSDDRDSKSDNRDSHRDARGPLVEKLRASPLSGYRDIAPPGYVPDPFCTSGGNGGAMGIHFVNGALLFDGVLDAANPEVLIYEPLPGGRIRLVGAEYIYFNGLPPDSVLPPDAPKAVEGHLLNYAGSPNRYGIPWDYLQLHIWAWKRNRNGTFADWNPDVSCDAYDPDQHPQPMP